MLRGHLVLAVCLGLSACGRTEPYQRIPRDGAVEDEPDAGAPDAGRPCPIAFDATVTASLRMTTDDEYRVFVNGALIDDVARLWHLSQTYPVGVFRHPSRATVIAIEGTNQQKIDGLDRGVIADLRVGSATVVTDSTWKLSIGPDAGWQLPTFDDSNWIIPTVVGAHGIQPWGSILGTSNAGWLWSYRPTGTASSKPTFERIWLRRTFYLRLDGGVSDVPTPCPSGN